MVLALLAAGAALAPAVDKGSIDHCRCTIDNNPTISFDDAPRPRPKQAPVLALPLCTGSTGNRAHLGCPTPPQALGLVQAEAPDNETKTEKAPQYYSAALNFWPWAFVRHAPAIPAHSPHAWHRSPRPALSRRTGTSS